MGLVLVMSVVVAVVVVQRMVQLEKIPPWVVLERPVI
jgi:hypothetical protein